MKTPIFVLVVCAAVLVVSCGARAVDMKAADNIVFPKDTKTTEDILAAGNRVSVDSTVGGDVTAAGNTVTVAGSVEDSVLLAGNTVFLTGSVGNDAWIAGSTVVMDGTVADNAYLAGSDVNMGEKARVGSDLLIGAGKANVNGNINGNLRIGAGQMSLGGTVNGNVYANAGSISLLNGAIVRGNLYYESANKVQIAPGARVMGETIRKIPPREKAAPVFWSKLGMWLVGLLMYIVFAVVFLAVFPVRTQESADTTRRSFWLSLAVGLIVLIVIPIACVIAAITIIGIPVAVAIFFIYLILLFASAVFVALALGQWILGRGRTTRPNPFGAVILGLVIIAVFVLVPFLGGLVKFFVTILGLGAFLLNWWRRRTAAAETVMVPPPAEPQPPIGPGE